jgi:hypothetical protein
LKAAELQRLYQLALDAELGRLGLKRRKGEYFTSLSPGRASVLVGMPYTWGRVSTFVNLAIRHDDFEERLRGVLGELVDDLPDHTMLAPLRSIAPGRWLDLDVGDENDARAAAATIAGMWAEVMLPYVQSVRPLVPLCTAYKYIESKKVPLALRLLGEAEALDAWLDRWDTSPDDDRHELARRYRERLPLVAPLET